MAYQVLARKWRPRSFATLVGQEHVVKALSNALENQRLHHAYLLTGTRGVGKTTIARILAKSLNCETGITAHPCGECSTCTQIDAGRFVDLLEIDAASNTGIDNIREVLDNAQYAPTQGRFKVYIIDEVHMLSKSAFNAMLKTLEEPPGHVKFILATTDPQKVPVTVLSRCLQFSLRQMLPQQVSTHLGKVLDAEGIPYEPEALIALGHAAAGSMRDALSLLDQAIAYGSGHVETAGVHAMLGAVDRSALFEVLGHIAHRNGAAMITAAEQLSARGIAADSALQELASILHLVALCQSVPAALGNDTPQLAAIQQLAGQMSPEDAQLYYQIAIHGRRDLALAPDEFAGMSMCLLRMLAFAPSDHPPPGGRRTTEHGSANPPPATQLLNEAAVAIVPSSIAQHRAEAVAAPAPIRQAPAIAEAVIPPPAPLPDAIPPWEDALEEHIQPLSLDDIQASRGDMAESIPASGELVPNGDWGALVGRMKSGGLANMLAMNAQLLRQDHDAIWLTVPQSKAAMAGESYQLKLADELERLVGRRIRLNVELGGEADATPAAKREQFRQFQLDAAVSALNDDHFVQTLMQEFGGTIKPDSIVAQDSAAS
ncbi:DNA polymerase III subunit gamma/tau [Burkholderiaceae bacterium DAT-1]|nr:DNA polymerase III subunit gamma/tau [Burkholderiaceae bacterium DAT-1]